MAILDQSRIIKRIFKKMKGYIAYFRKHPAQQETFLKDKSTMSIVPVEYVRANGQSFYVNYGGDRNRWFMKVTDFYTFHVSYTEALDFLANHCESLAKFKITESDNFKRDAADLREKAKILKRDFKHEMEKISS